jgi:hypothetical protein
MAQPREPSRVLWAVCPDWEGGCVLVQVGTTTLRATAEQCRLMSEDLWKAAGDLEAGGGTPPGAPEPERDGGAALARIGAR